MKFILCMILACLFSCSYYTEIESKVEPSLSGPYNRINIIIYSNDNWDLYIDKFIKFLHKGFDYTSSKITTSKYKPNPLALQESGPNISFENSDIVFIITPISGESVNGDVNEFFFNVRGYIPLNINSIYFANIKARKHYGPGSLYNDGGMTKIVSDFIIRLKTDGIIR